MGSYNVHSLNNRGFIMKEVFINVNDGMVKWWGPNTSGSEPMNGNKNETIGRVISCMMDLAKARGEDWSFRISKQPGV